MGFAKDFVWGAASSAYQVEGAANQDGRGSSVWDEFCTRPGMVHQNETGEIACDHYHRYRDDVKLMETIGLHAYRFSISWPRVLPEGVGRVNEKGIEFYDRLIDALLEANVTPWLTLFHWDMPEALFRRGGWLNRDSAEWFAEYAGLMAERFSDRVKHWMTLNEPQVYINLGHLEGKHAPGLKLSFRECLLAGHHTMLAHGRAVQTLRAKARQPLLIGWAPVGSVACPATESPEDVEAARLAMFSVKRRDFWNNTWFGDPACLGHYPQDGVEFFGEDAPKYGADDLKTICQPLDFYGLNTYSGTVVRAGTEGEPIDVPAPPGAPLTTFRWLIRPEVLYWGPKLIQERYRLPVVITENGMANVDFVNLDGKIEDPQRIDYTRRHLLQLRRAAESGVDIRGYFHWSVMDNFEWAEGYRERFGLIHVDYANQQRRLKASAHWYKKVIQSNGDSLSVLPSTQANAPMIKSRLDQPVVATRRLS